MDYVELVKKVARAVGSLKEDGTLARLDSLNIIDMVVELETSANIAIPPEKINLETFASIESVAHLLKELQA